MYRLANDKSFGLPAQNFGDNPTQGQTLVNISDERKLFLANSEPYAKASLVI